MCVNVVEGRSSGGVIGKRRILVENEDVGKRGAGGREILENIASVMSVE